MDKEELMKQLNEAGFKTYQTAITYATNQLQIFIDSFETMIKRTLNKEYGEIIKNYKPKEVNDNKKKDNMDK